MTSTIADLENKIKIGLNDFCTGLGRKEWNAKIRQILQKIIKDNYEGKYECQFPGLTEGVKDCMFDFACYEYYYEEKYDDTLEISSYSRRNAFFVAEIEWDDLFENNVQPDFEKLLVARANYRLMVFRTENEKTANNCFKFLNEIVDKFERTEPDDNYIYAVSLNNERGRFITHSRITR